MDSKLKTKCKHDPQNNESKWKRQQAVVLTKVIKLQINELEACLYNEFLYEHNFEKTLYMSRDCSEGNHQCFEVRR